MVMMTVLMIIMVNWWQEEPFHRQTPPCDRLSKCKLLSHASPGIMIKLWWRWLCNKWERRILMMTVNSPHLCNCTPLCLLLPEIWVYNLTIFNIIPGILIFHNGSCTLIFAGPCTTPSWYSNSILSPEAAKRAAGPVSLLSWDVDGVDHEVHGEDGEDD